VVKKGDRKREEAERGKGGKNTNYKSKCLFPP
jgi:hypothetical protein